MKTIRPNYTMLVTRLIFLGAFLYFIGLIINNLITGKYHDSHIIVYFGMVAFALWPFYLIWSLVGIFRVEFSEADKAITFIDLKGTGKDVNVSEIIGYYQTTYKTRFKNFGGYIFKLQDGSTVEVIEYNLASLKGLYVFMTENQIRCLGTKTSWYPLKRKV